MKLNIKALVLIFAGLILVGFPVYLLHLVSPELNIIFIFTVYVILAGLLIYRLIDKYFIKNLLAIKDSLPSENSVVDIPAKITELKMMINRLQQELKLSEEQFKIFTDKRYELIFRFSKDYEITFVNKPFSRFIGIKSDQLIGRNVTTLFDGDSEFLMQGLRQPSLAISEERKFDFHKDSYWVEWSFSEILNTDNEIIEYQVLGHDITERKRIEEALRGSKARNLALLKAIPDIVFRFHTDGSLLDYHLPPTDNMRIPPEKLLTNNINGVFSEDLSDKIKELISQVFETGDIQLFEYQTVEADEMYYEEIRVVATEQDEYIVIIRDITERKRAEEEVKRYIEEMQFNEDILAKNSFELQELYGKLTESESELKELNAKKDKFFSIISHDLRSPFTAIVGFSRILVEDIDELPPDQIKSFAQNICESSENVLKLLENLLYWSRLQTNRIQYEPQQVFLKKVVDETLGLYKANVLEKNITMTNRILNDSVAWADKNMLDAILRNLISNALKFTRNSGSITVGGQNKKDWIELYVEDSGVGISDENLAKLFKIDEHITTQGTNKEKGTGLGLILCKEFIERNGGTIRVESKLNTGTRFIFTLPAA